jgi:hypothetical protein
MHYTRLMLVLLVLATTSGLALSPSTFAVHPRVPCARLIYGAPQNKRGSCQLWTSDRRTVNGATLRHLYLGSLTDGACSMASTRSSRFPLLSKASSSGEEETVQPPAPSMNSLYVIAGLQVACFGFIGTSLPPALSASGLEPAAVALMLGRLGSISAFFEVTFQTKHAFARVYCYRATVVKTSWHMHICR